MLGTKISSTLAISTFSFSEHDFPPQLSKQTMSLTLLELSMEFGFLKILIE